MNEILAPYFGASYYPENWTAEKVDEDISLMKEAGMNVVRMAEFAWSRMEPKEGVYDFEWLHIVIRKMKAAGMAVILCSPTCTPPIWLTKKHPEILFTYEDGSNVKHGGRRHACLSNETYRDYCRKIVKKMALEFGSYDNLIGWQIDNEIYPLGEVERRLVTLGKSTREGRGCCCSVCVNKFREHLKNKFGTIEELNSSWGMNLWSQTYSSFDEITYPDSMTWYHPSHISAWMNFQAQACIEFVENQSDVLHEYVTQPVGTDMMTYGGISYFEMHRKLDVAQMNFYNGMGRTLRAAFWMDVTRSLKDKPFWNMESTPNWTGATSCRAIRSPGFVRVSSWLPIAMGGESTVFWHWRSHWSGQEIMFGTVIDSTGRPLHNFDEIKTLGREFKTASDFLRNTKVNKSQMALHFSSWAFWMFASQPIVGDFNYIESINDDYYKPLNEEHIKMDVIDPEADISSYKLICSPFLPALDQGGLRERLIDWINNGGIWIAGPMTDLRTLHATKYTHSPYGSLEKWADMFVKCELPIGESKYSLNWEDGTKSPGLLYYSGMAASENNEVIAEYDEGPLKGLAAVVSKKVGKGKIIVLGTLPNAQQLKHIVLSAMSEAGIRPSVKASQNILYAPREGFDYSGAVVIEFANEEGEIILEQDMIDVLTQKTFYKGKHILSAYSVHVFKSI